MPNKNESKELPDEVIYDLLRQLPIATTDDHLNQIENVYNGLSLKGLVVDWIYDALKMPDAPVIEDWSDPDFDEILGYLDTNIPAYVEALCRVVCNWNKLKEDA